MITERDRRIVQEFKRLMIARGVSVREVILFGSRARGDAEPDSDMDVLVIIENLDRQIRKLITRCAWEVGYESGVVIQSMAMTRSEAEEGPERSSLLMLAVREEGVRV
jgi:predicted nucleotidyltransferase